MVSDKRCVMCDSVVGEDMAQFLWVVGNLREVGRCCWVMCEEFCGPASGWMNFEVLTRGKRGIVVGKRCRGHM